MQLKRNKNENENESRTSVNQYFTINLFLWAWTLFQVEYQFIDELKSRLTQLLIEVSNWKQLKRDQKSIDQSNVISVSFCLICEMSSKTSKTWNTDHHQWSKSWCFLICKHEFNGLIYFSNLRLRSLRSRGRSKEKWNNLIFRASFFYYFFSFTELRNK